MKSYGAIGIAIVKACNRKLAITAFSETGE